MALILPNTIRNGIPVDGNNLEANFDAIENHANTELINKDGSVAMTGALTLAADPTTGNHAVRKSFMDSTITATFPTQRWTRTTDQAVSAGGTYAVVWESSTGSSAGWTQSSSTLTCTADGVYLFALHSDWSNSNGVSISLCLPSTTNRILPDAHVTNSGAFHVSTGGVLYVRSGTDLRVVVGTSVSGSSTLQEARVTVTQLGTI